jgi:hypothetical protein
VEAVDSIGLGSRCDGWLLREHRGPQVGDCDDGILECLMTLFVFVLNLM